MKKLQTNNIDLYLTLASIGLMKNISIEETIYTMSEFVKAGRVKYIGLSEVSAEAIRKTHNVHPITTVQTEYSLFEKTIERLGILNVL